MAMRKLIVVGICLYLTLFTSLGKIAISLLTRKDLTGGVDVFSLFSTETEMIKQHFKIEFFNLATVDIL